MNIQIEQLYDTLNNAFLNSIYQMSNNRKMTWPKQPDFTLIVDDITY